MTPDDKTAGNPAQTTLLVDTTDHSTLDEDLTLTQESTESLDEAWRELLFLEMGRPNHIARTAGLTHALGPAKLSAEGRRRGGGGEGRLEGQLSTQ